MVTWLWLNGIAIHRKSIWELWSVTCYMGLHSIVCHPTGRHTACCSPSQTGRYSIYLPQVDGRLSWPCCWLYMYT